MLRRAGVGSTTDEVVAVAQETNFDPVLLRTFLAVATGLSFTRAAEQLGLSQPTVSQHIRRLEEAAKRQLVRRDTRSVSLTDNGQAMAGFARTILAANDEAVSYFTGSAMSGRLRFGAADELALSELPTILRQFRELYPRINLELTVTQSGTLYRRLAANHLDLIFINQEADLGRGHPGPARPAGLGRDRAARSWPPSSRSRSSPTTRRASAGPPRSTPSTRRAAPGGSPATPARSTASSPRPAPASASACWPRAGCPGDLRILSGRFDLPALPDVEMALVDNPRAAREPVEALSRAIVNLPLAHLAANGVSR